MTYRILLIENAISAETRTFLTLSALGQVIRARSIIEAIAQCNQMQPDIVIADCPMTGLDAREVLRELKDNGCRAPVVGLAHDDGVAVDEPGFAAILAKPVPAEELQRTVGVLLTQIRPQNSGA